ncbi:hypothetical protein Z949_2794 [Sulfitobacter guttiformis KCTC 32187]|nr:hypothetical protein Z949_2794 [Sulfitobacter guttiformis KCTC 32187]
MSKRVGKSDMVYSPAVILICFHLTPWPCALQEGGKRQVKSGF